MKEMNKPTVRAIAADVVAALSAVAAKHGVSFSYKGGSYSSTSCTLKIEAAVIGENGIVETAERTNYKTYAAMYELYSDWLDTTFMNRGQEFKIVGLRPNSAKSPVICERADGKRFVFPVEIIKYQKGVAA
jgi:hypothetical protein